MNMLFSSAVSRLPDHDVALLGLSATLSRWPLKAVVTEPNPLLPPYSSSPGCLPDYNLATSRVEPEKPGNRQLGSPKQIMLGKMIYENDRTIDF